MHTAQVHIGQLNNVTWNDGDLCPFAISNEPDIWKICISKNIRYLNGFWLLLSADEQTRANGYYRLHDRQRFIISRGCLRVLLSKYLNITAQSIIFEAGANKKPGVKAGRQPIHYNVSHAGDYILIAVGNAAVGADVERLDENPHFEDIMEISFSVDEVAYVKNATEPLTAFYTFWTRKEALLKATGKGIDDDMKFVPGIAGMHTLFIEITGPANTWFVNSFNVDEYHLGCVAAIFNVQKFWYIKKLSALTNNFSG